MIGRRGFITGLVSLVAAPAIARERYRFPSIPVFWQQTFTAQTVVVEQNDCFNMCTFFRCCIVIPENTTEAIFFACKFLDCTFDLVSLQRFMRESIFEFSGSNEIRLDCKAEPTS